MNINEIRGASIPELLQVQSLQTSATLLSAEC